MKGIVREAASAKSRENWENFDVVKRFPSTVFLLFCFVLGGRAHAQAQARRPVPNRASAQPATVPPRDAAPSPAQAAPSQAQIKLGQSSLPLYGPWKFSIGDSPIDPATHAPLWAEPGFDDAAWETVDLTPREGALDPLGGQAGYVPGWTVKGHPGYWGYAWYRLRVRVAAPPAEKLSVDGPADVDDAYQLYANGVLLGSFGDFSSVKPVVYYAQPMIFPLPELTPENLPSPTNPPLNSAALPDAPSENTTVLLSLRVWMGPSELLTQPDAGGLHSAPFIGSAATVAAQHQILWLNLIRTFALCPLEAYQFLLLALASFTIILFDRSDRAYLWMGLVYLLSAADLIVVAVNTWTQRLSAYAGIEIRHFFLVPLSYAAWAMVWWVWFRLRRPRWMPIAIAALALLLAVSYAIGDNLFFTAIPQPVSLAFHTVSLTVRLIWIALLLWIAIEGICEQGLEGWLALPAVLLLGVSRFQNELAVLHIQAFWFPLRTQISLGDLAVFLLTLVVALLLLRRMLRSVSRQREMALDVRQAQEVQQVIVPQARTTVAGLEIETEYRPALEVGGDFFQLLPHPTDGSLLIVAGDVTGKGLQAGMLVALIVGAIRTAVRFDADPVVVIRTLNQLLCARGHANATCLALRILADGGVTLVNAGHMPPWLNGEQLAIGGALPLGIYEGAEPSLLRFTLNPSDRLLLLSDGIVEARNSKGELYGFERVQQLLESRPSAAEVAAAAQRFGQDDDISVIAITRSPAPA
jgi:hypothetical protein